MNYDSVLKKITPSPEEINSLNYSLKKISSSIKENSKQENFEVEVVVGGSTAKGTFLKGDFDVDIFVRFKTNGDLSLMLEKILINVSEKLSFTIELIHGSRDYFQFTYNNFFFEIIPVKFIEDISQSENITDMSPLHVFWVKDKLSSNLIKDIRLAKQFCKANNIYGAESYINGISGHVLDILIIYYGGFEKFILAVSQWTKPVVIDPENKHHDVFEELNQSKLSSPLIVVDPIDPQRNASAALSNEKFNLLISSAKSFLKNPKNSFFEIKQFNIENLKNKILNDEILFIIKINPLEGKKDVVATKVLKIFEFFSRHLQLYDFKIINSGWHYDPVNCVLFFFLENKVLDETFEREGPPLNNEIACTRFKEVHKNNFYEKNNRLFVKVKRDFIEPTSCFKHLIKDPFVLSRSSFQQLEIFKSQK